MGKLGKMSILGVVFCFNSIIESSPNTVLVFYAEKSKFWAFIVKWLQGKSINLKGFVQFWASVTIMARFDTILFRENVYKNVLCKLKSDEK